MQKSNILFWFILVFLMASLFFACGPDQSDALNDLTIEKSKNSASLNFSKNDKIGKVNGEELIFTVDQDQIIEVMESNYKDGTKINEVYLEKQQGQYYLIGKGFNDKNESRILRYLLNTDSKGSLITVNGVADSCNGVNCSYCVFTAGSGCNCQTVGDPWNGDRAYCNHSTSTRMAGLQLLNSAVAAAEATEDGVITGNISSDQIDPELLDQLSQGTPLTTDTDFVISEETMNDIYASSGVPAMSEGPVTIGAGTYDVEPDLEQGIIIITVVVETEDYILIWVIVIATP